MPPPPSRSRRLPRRRANCSKAPRLRTARRRPRPPRRRLPPPSRPARRATRRWPIWPPPASRFPRS
ncbi:hypothetical protein E2978_18095 [Paracoccus yeei]